MKICFKALFSTVLLGLLVACGPAKTPEQEAADFEEASTALMGAMEDSKKAFNAMNPSLSAPPSGSVASAPAPVASGAQ